jgi:hypothetical protein
LAIKAARLGRPEGFCTASAGAIPAKIARDVAPMAPAAISLARFVRVRILAPLAVILV